MADSAKAEKLSLDALMDLSEDNIIWVQKRDWEKARPAIVYRNLDTEGVDAIGASFKLEDRDYGKAWIAYDKCPTVEQTHRAFKQAVINVDDYYEFLGKLKQCGVGGALVDDLCEITRLVEVKKDE